MVFSSTIFLFGFLPIVLLCYHLVPRSLKNLVLIVASLVFYFWGETFFVGVMLVSIGANYVFGLLVDRSRGRRAAKVLVGLAVAANLALLVVYKYANFAVDNLNRLLARLEIEPLEIGDIGLPIGISFFTFQAMSYVIDLYRGEAKVQKNPLNLTLYISLFPQLIAGPIVRYRQIEKQLTERSVRLDEMALGVRRFVIGLGKKVLLATPLEAPVAAIFDELPADQLTPGIAWLGVVCYMLQLYFDFSGYSDMAIGLGRMLGFKFPENFNYPFVARSVRNLWTRWHMSLTTWFRDYLYIPMGGNRGGAARTHFNLLTVFVLCGLWHGAHWNYVLFGLYHGIFLVLERMRPFGFLRATPVPLQHVYTLVVWMFGLAIFRTNTFASPDAVLGSAPALEWMAAMVGFGPAGSPRTVLEFLTPEVLLVLPIAALASLPVMIWVQRRFERAIESSSGAARSWIEGSGAFVAVTGLLFVLFLSALHLASSTNNPFIYFRF